MNCNHIQERLSLHLDNALPVSERRAVEAHVEACGPCRRDLTSLLNTQSALASLGRRPAPPDLALKIKVAVMRQRERSFKRRLEGFAVRLENAVNGLMLPATAGLVTAVIFFGLFVGFFAQPPSVSAANDVPTLLYTPPRLQYSSLMQDDASDLESPIVIEAFINPQGRVEDYRILSGADSPQLRKQLDRSLLFAVFQPAMAFGAPASGRVVISFTAVNVKG